MTVLPGFPWLLLVVFASSWFQPHPVTCLDDATGHPADHLVKLEKEEDDAGSDGDPFNPRFPGKSDSNKVDLDLDLVLNPTLEKTPSLAECARHCQERPACKIFLFATFKPKDFNCGFGYNESDSSKTKDAILKQFLYFQIENRTSSGLEYGDHCHTYIHLNDSLGESRAISVSPSSNDSDSCPIGLGTGSRSRIKIHIRCTGDCHGREQWVLRDVIRHHVTDNGTQKVVTEEAASACVNAKSQNPHLTFVTSTGGVMLIDVQQTGNASDRKFQLELDVTTVGENYVCTDCYDLDTPSPSTDVIACQLCNLTEGQAACRHACCNNNLTATSTSSSLTTTTTAVPVSDSKNATKTPTPINAVNFSHSPFNPSSTKDLNIVTLPTFHGVNTRKASVRPKSITTSWEPTSTRNSHDIDTNVTSRHYDVTGTVDVNNIIDTTNATIDNSVTELSDEEKDDNDDNQATVIGSAVGGALAGMGLISTLVAFLLRRRPKNKVDDAGEESTSNIEME